MTWVATAIVGSSLVGGYFSNKAAKAQSRAARDSQNLSKDQFDRTIELNAPFREAGLTAQNRMLTLLGLKDGEATAGGGFRGPLAPGQAPPGEF